jgi:hypothetical protein
MGTQFHEVVCDENGIGGGGDFSGSSDIKLDRVSAFLAPCVNRPRDVPRCGALSALQKTHKTGLGQWK